MCVSQQPEQQVARAALVGSFMKRNFHSTTVMANQLIEPHGGSLVNLMAPAGEAASIAASCSRTLELSDRNACDVELLTVGGFSPLTGFMNEVSVVRVLFKVVVCRVN